MSNPVEQTVIDGLSINEMSDLEELGKYTYNQSKDRLNTVGSILKKMFGENWNIILILILVNILILIILKKLATNLY